MFDKIVNWAFGALLASTVLVFAVTLNLVYVFSIMIFGGIIYGINRAGERDARGEVKANCWIIVGLLGDFVFTGSLLSFLGTLGVFLITVYASALVLLKVSAEDIDKMHQEAP